MNRKDINLIAEAFYGNNDAVSNLAKQFRYNNAVKRILKDLAHHGKIANLEADNDAFEAMLHAFAAGYHMREKI